MSEQNKATARRALEEVYGGKNLNTADEVYAPDFVDHDPSAPPEMTQGPEGVKQQAQMYRSAFPDLQMSVDAQYAEGDAVVTRWTARGTHEGELMGVAATGNSVTITGITIDRVADDRIAEEWTNWDGLGLMQQIGAVPAAP